MSTKNTEDKDSFKVLIVGDKGTGKTALIHRIAEGEFVELDIQGVKKKEIQLKSAKRSKLITLKLWDTDGNSYPGEDLYENTECVVICFSVVNRSSFNNVFEKWYKDLLVNKMSDVQIILVGTKLDLFLSGEEETQKDKEGFEEVNLQDEKNKIIVGNDEAKRMKKKVGGFTYMCCSSKSGDLVEDVFQEIANQMDKLSILQEQGEGNVKKKKGGLFASLSGGSMKDELTGMGMIISSDEEDDF